MHTFTHPVTYTQTSPPAQGEAQLSPLDNADISALDDAQLSAMDAALNYRPSRQRRKHFTRVLVRKLGSETYTTVCLDDEYFLVAMRFAYEEMSVLTTALRKAALLVKDDRPGHFSRAVRARALLSLRGNYQPGRAAALALAKADAAQILADVNNAAWATAQA
jgi:hypothetical protein